MGKILEFPTYWLCESAGIKHEFYSKDPLEAATMFFKKALSENKKVELDEFITVTNNNTQVATCINSDEVYKLI